MANVRNVYQQSKTVSIPKSELLDYVVFDEELKKNDLRVILTLLTELDGWSTPERGMSNDPCNYRKIDVEQIADNLNLKVKEVKESVKKLVKRGILEKGNSTTVVNGYRFKF